VTEGESGAFLSLSQSLGVGDTRTLQSANDEAETIEVPCTKLNWEMKKQASLVVAK